MRLLRKIQETVFYFLHAQPKEGKDFTGKIRKKMDDEVVIEGFSEENILKCCSRYLGRKEARRFLEEVKKQADLYELLKVPIILLITSVLYKEDDKKSLPERETALYENLYEFLMDRSTFKSNHLAVIHLKFQTSKICCKQWGSLRGRLYKRIINSFSLRR